MVTTPHRPRPRARGIPLRILRQLDPVTRRQVRRGLTLLALVPLTALVAIKGADLTGDPWLNAYGIGVLMSTIAIIYVAFTHYEDPSIGAPPFGADPPLVSCLVAVKDDVHLIEPCVRSLLDSTYPNLEVIVVDDGSTDGTSEVLERLAAETELRLVSLPHNVGKKRALASAVAHANGSILAFTDSDCVVADNAVGRCVAALQRDPELGGVSGHARALNGDASLLARIQDVWYDGQFGVAKAAESVYGSVTCVSGPLAVFRREAVINYFPAWAADRFAGQEFRFATDRQLTAYVLGQEWVGEALKRAHADHDLVAAEDHPPRRWKVGYVRSARVVTEVPPTLRTLVRQQVRWKKSFIRNLFFTGRFFWRRGMRPSAIFYSHAVWVLLAPLMAFRHLVFLPLRGAWWITILYLLGVVVKGAVWGVAHRLQNPGADGWVLRPLMSVLSAVLLSWLLVYAAVTLRRNRWWRTADTPTRLLAGRGLVPRGAEA